MVILVPEFQIILLGPTLRKRLNSALFLVGFCQRFNEKTVASQTSTFCVYVCDGGGGELRRTQLSSSSNSNIVFCVQVLLDKIGTYDHS